MSRKNVLAGYKLVTTQSLAASFQSNPVTVATIDNVGFNISTASVTTNTGTFGVQHRMIKDANNYSAWCDLSFGSVPTLANANATFLLNLNQLPPGQVRVTYTATGTPDGTCDVWVSGCAVGG